MKPFKNKQYLDTQTQYEKTLLSLMHRHILFGREERLKQRDGINKM